MIGPQRVSRTEPLPPAPTLAPEELAGGLSAPAPSWQDEWHAQVPRRRSRRPLTMSSVGAAGFALLVNGP